MSALFAKRDDAGSPGRSGVDTSSGKYLVAPVGSPEHEHLEVEDFDEFEDVADFEDSGDVIDSVFGGPLPNIFDETPAPLTVDVTAAGDRDAPGMSTGDAIGHMPSPVQQQKAKAAPVLSPKLDLLMQVVETSDRLKAAAIHAKKTAILNDLFLKHDADNSGALDIGELKHLIAELEDGAWPTTWSTRRQPIVFFPARVLGASEFRLGAGFDVDLWTFKKKRREATAPVHALSCLKPHARCCAACSGVTPSTEEVSFVLQMADDAHDSGNSDGEVPQHVTACHWPSTAFALLFIGLSLPFHRLSLAFALPFHRLSLAFALPFHRLSLPFHRLSTLAAPADRAGGALKRNRRLVRAQA